MKSKQAVYRNTNSLKRMISHTSDQDREIVDLSSLAQFVIKHEAAIITPEINHVSHQKLSNAP